MTDSHFGIALELTGVRPSQYSGYNFNSMCRFGDMYLGANEHGIFQLEDGEFDYPDGTTRTEITAYFGLPTSDWGVPNPKTIRRLHVGYESDGPLTVTITPSDRGVQIRKTLNPPEDHERQGFASVDGRSDFYARYWSVRIENSIGSDFSIDAIEAVMVVLGTGRK